MPWPGPLRSEQRERSPPPKALRTPLSNKNHARVPLDSPSGNTRSRVASRSGGQKIGFASIFGASTVLALMNRLRSRSKSMRESGSHIIHFVKIRDTELVANESAFVGHTPFCLRLFVRASSSRQRVLVYELSGTRTVLPSFIARASWHIRLSNLG